MVFNIGLWAVKPHLETTCGKRSLVMAHFALPRVVLLGKRSRNRKEISQWGRVAVTSRVGVESGVEWSGVEWRGVEWSGVDWSRVKVGVE